jgi:hypothetical protein
MSNRQNPLDFEGNSVKQNNFIWNVTSEGNKLKVTANSGNTYRIGGNMLEYFFVSYERGKMFANIERHLSFIKNL